MIEFSASTYTYLWKSDLRRAVAEIAAAGFDSLEVMVAPPHVVVHDGGLRVAEELREAASEAGVRVSSVLPSGLDVNLASPDGTMRDWSVQHYLAVGEFAAAAGARYLVVHPGRRHPFKPVPYHAGRKLVLEGVTRIAEALEGSGLRLVFENTPTAILDRAEDCADLVEELVEGLGRDGAGVCYDVANGFMVEDPRDGLRAVAGTLELVHLSDTTAAEWMHAPVGTGEVDFAAVAETLKDLGFEGPLVVETIHRAAVPEGLRRDLAALRSAGFGHATADSSAR